MKIGIIDIDCHADKKQFGATIYPNLALCKIAAYHKAQGDSVEWATPFDEYEPRKGFKCITYINDFYGKT